MAAKKCAGGWIYPVALDVFVDTSDYLAHANCFDNIVEK